MTIPAKKPDEPGSIESALMLGDLSKLTTDQRLEYYNSVCKSLGLNPLTRPFDYLTLNGKLTLYARRDAADQLRKINGISVDIISREFSHDLLTVHVRARDKDGRTDEDLGVVNFPETLKGEAAANTILKAVTKAKRRVTLSISGLGFLDETEVADIPHNAKAEAEPQNESPPPAEETGEVVSADEADFLEKLLLKTNVSIHAFLRKADLIGKSISDLPASKYQNAVQFLENRVVK